MCQTCHPESAGYYRANSCPISFPDFQTNLAYPTCNQPFAARSRSSDGVAEMAHRQPFRWFLVVRGFPRLDNLPPEIPVMGSKYRRTSRLGRTPWAANASWAGPLCHSDGARAEPLSPGPNTHQKRTLNVDNKGYRRYNTDIESARILEREDSILEAQAMYQPALRPDQIRALYLMKTRVQRPMTALVREAVDQYLEDGFLEGGSPPTIQDSSPSASCPQDSPRHGPRG